MTTPQDPQQPDSGSERLSPPQTSAEAAGSIRERLASPEPANAPVTSGPVTDADFRNTDSAAALHSGTSAGHGERQQAQGAPAPAPHHKAPLTPHEAKVAERKVASLFLLALLSVIAFVVVYFAWPWRFEDAGSRGFTPLLGLFMGLALLGVGAGAVLWAKLLMVDEEAVQERHDFASTPEDRSATAAALRQGLEDTGLPRRSLLRNSMLLGAGSLALLPIPFVLGLGRWQDKELTLETTDWTEGMRLIRTNGTAVRLGDLQIGSVESVFPDVPGGSHSHDGAVLLIRMRPEELQLEGESADWAYEGHVAYSSICTHLGCPVKLYEQRTHHLLCPCHQSTFDASRGSEVIFGPAARPLPQLAISVDDDGFFIAQGDFFEPTGPSYWERRP